MKVCSVDMARLWVGSAGRMVKSEVLGSENRRCYRALSWRRGSQSATGLLGRLGCMEGNQRAVGGRYSSMTRGSNKLRSEVGVADDWQQLSCE